MIASFIQPSSHWILLLSVLAMAFGSLWLEQNVAWASRVSGPVLALLMGMAMSNLRLLPADAPCYDIVDTYFVPAAIPLLLLRSNIFRILKETGSMFAAFHVAAVGSVLGALLAGFLFKGQLDRLPEVCGIMAASYIGGAVNFVAVQKSYGVGGDLANPLIVADNIIMAALFAGLLLLAGSRWMLARYLHPHTGSGSSEDAKAAAALHWRRKELSLVELSFVLLFGFGIAALSIEATQWLKSVLQSKVLLAIFANAYLLITFLTVSASTLWSKHFDRLEAGEDIGMFFLYLFFVVIGLHADLGAVVRQMPVLFLVCLVIAMTNLTFTLIVGRLLKMNLEELLLAVNATLGGAPTAAAMAISRGWSRLVLPGLLSGIWGYIIGTLLGVLVVESLRKIL